MSTSAYCRGNHLLDALPAADKLRIYPQLEAIRLPLGLVLYDDGLGQKYAYFPTAAVVSLQYLMTNGNVAETAAVGNEGIVGTSIFLGADSTPGRAIVKCAGRGFRIKSQVIKEEFYRAGPLMRLLLRYTQALITQMSQTAVCNGIRREGVTESARRLQNAGLIRYARGHIAVLDRRGLERRSCECYVVIKKEYERLLPREITAAGTLPGDHPRRSQRSSRTNLPSPATLH